MFSLFYLLVKTTKTGFSDLEKNRFQRFEIVKTKWIANRRKTGFRTAPWIVAAFVNGAGTIYHSGALEIWMVGKKLSAMLTKYHFFALKKYFNK